ncbi:cytochrome c551 [Neobacillus cucumis]|uniref:Cytochrome C551 n=1 Tax=Neobacillus cucumis TaxID=1740721 RepID=A0A2N5HFS0_9BACI|nr:cytochrome c [Neobacillus cucumis]PLS04352.1 cytochrome C551 [Neobacillus cucumis]
MKKKLLTLLLGTSLVMGLAACGGGGDKDTTKKDTGGGGTETSNASDAQKIFDQKCSSCHGGDMKGGMGPNLTKVGSKYSKDEILDILKNGKSGGMPAGLVTGDDANTIATWLAAKK